MVDMLLAAVMSLSTPGECYSKDPMACTQPNPNASHITVFTHPGRPGEYPGYGRDYCWQQLNDPDEHNGPDTYCTVEREEGWTP